MLLNCCLPALEILQLRWDWKWPVFPLHGPCIHGTAVFTETLRLTRLSSCAYLIPFLLLDCIILCHPSLFSQRKSLPFSFQSPSMDTGCFCLPDTCIRSPFWALRVLGENLPCALSVHVVYDGKDLTSGLPEFTSEPGLTKVFIPSAPQGSRDEQMT